MYYGSITGYVRSDGGQLEARTFWVGEDGSIQGTGGELLPILGHEPVELAGWAFSRAIEYAYDGEGIPVLIGQKHSITRKQLVKLGGKVWSRGNQRRIYIDPASLLPTTKTTRPRIKTSKFWMDAETGQFHADGLLGEEVSAAITTLELMAGGNHAHRNA
jgi:hypothetical protein